MTNYPRKPGTFDIYLEIHLNDWDLPRNSSTTRKNYSKLLKTDLEIPEK